MADTLDFRQQSTGRKPRYRKARVRSQLPVRAPSVVNEVEEDDQALPGWIPTWPLIAKGVRRNWHLCLVIVAFMISALFIPVMADVPSTDDWAYSRSVEMLIHDGKLEILDLTVVTLLFQVAWGTLFSVVFGVGFGAMRLSTVVLVGLSIPAMYDICRSLGAKRSLAAAGAALYVFNPLTYSLAFTFMSDPQFAALMVISVSLYLRAIRNPEQRRGFLIAGSIGAALAFLVRQQGLLIPAGVGAYFFVTRQWWFNRQGIKTLLQVAGIPLVTAVLYFLWVRLFVPTPEQQDEFIKQITGAGLNDTRLLLGRITFIEVIYSGFFVLPLALAILPIVHRWRPKRDRRTLAILAIWAIILVVGCIVFFHENRLMPYIPQFVGFHGLGPNDINGGRVSLVSHEVAVAATWLCIGTAVMFGLYVANAAAKPPSREQSAAGMFAMLGFFQVLGVLPPSFHFMNWIISVDRYLLALVPFAIGLLIWSVRDLRISQPVLWPLIGLLAVFCVVATRDSIVFQQATWAEARRAISYGVPLTMLDAGASWDGYHLYEYSEASGIETQTAGGPWWTDLFGKATNSTYVVATIPMDGYTIIEYREYSSWLNPDPTYIYLLRRDTWPGPP